MKNTITTIIIGICLISLASALYVGESQTYTANDLGLDNISNAIIINNTSLINLVYDNLTLNISIPNDAEVQNFTIITDGYTHGVETTSSSSSSGGSGSCIYNNYNYCTHTNLSQQNKNNTSEFLIDSNRSITGSADNNSNTSTYIPQPVSEDSKRVWVIVISLIFFAILTYYAIQIFRNKGEQNE